MSVRQCHMTSHKTWRKWVQIAAETTENVSIVFKIFHDQFDLMTGLMMMRMMMKVRCSV